MSRRWKGKLAQPIKLSPPPAPPTLLTLIGDPEREANYKKDKEKWLHEQKIKYMGETAIRLKALCEHYGITNDNNNEPWFNLALALARDHVPGFRIEQDKQSGRPKERDESFLARLYFDFEKAKEERKAKGLPAKITDICRTLANDENYKGMSKKTLGNLYQQAKASQAVDIYNKLAAGFPKEASEIFRSIYTTPS